MLPLLLCYVLPVGAASQQIDHMFRYRADGGVKKVNLAGSFNGWNKGANPMNLGADGRTWSLSMKLKPGAYQYKFVLNEETWVVDPNAKTWSDGNGNTNSVLALAPADYAAPARKGDGKFATSTLSHKTTVPDFNWDRGKLTISLTARPNDIQSVTLIANGKRTSMKPIAADDLYERYRASIPWNRKSDLRYEFELDDRGEKRYLGSKGLLAKSNPITVSAREFRPFVVPRWVEKTVLYQIFPDRFANGDKSNDPKGVQAWDAKPTYYNRFGGDFAGVREHMGYLKDLGIGAIYFNPIFQSPSNHRYETIDYKRVDPELGTNGEFSSLTRDLKKSGIRTILDGVFHITGVDFAGFKDLREKGAASKYVSWYRAHSFPIKVAQNPNYDAWYGYPSMPQLNVLNPATKEYLLSVPEFWHRNAEIGGWRLDVAQDVPQPYWREFRKKVKGLDPQDWIVGEFWGDSTPWLGGDQWDASMNYLFRDAVLSLVSKEGSGKPTDLMGKLMNAYGLYAPQVARNQMNLLGSHDTARILTVCGGDRDLAKLAAVIQFTWVGTPCIYYGDELGMAGGADPDNRRGMAWSEATNQNEFLKLYKSLVGLRKSSDLLQSGEPVRLLADDSKQTAAYARVLGDRAAFVAVNRSATTQTVTLQTSRFTPHASFTNALTGQAVDAKPDGTVSIQLAPKRAAILMPRSGFSSRSRLQGRQLGAPVGATSLLFLSAQEHE